MDTEKKKWYNISDLGGIAQPVRALASHARGPRFESVCLHQKSPPQFCGGLFYTQKSRLDVDLFINL